MSIAIRDKVEINLEYKPIIDKFISQHFNIKLNSENVEYFNMHIFHAYDLLEFSNSPSRFDTLNIYNFNEKNFWLVKHIYDNNNKKLMYNPNINYFNENFEKIITILSAFYEDINVIYASDCSFDLERDSIIKSEEDIVQISFYNKIYKSFDPLEQFKPFLKFFRCKNDDFIEYLFSDLYLYGGLKNIEVTINSKQSIEELKTNLNLIKVLLI